jgi:hypothetical protein
MQKKTVELTDQEISIIESALNHYWNDANDQLTNGGAIMYAAERRPLGDIEKGMLEKRMQLVKPLLMDMENA